MSLSVGIEVESAGEVSRATRQLIASLKAGATLHQRIAVEAEETTEEHLTLLDQQIAHKTARDLGAEPSGHLAKQAGSIESESSETRALVRGPRRSRLRAAFGAYTVRPTGGRQFLAFPAHRTTYNRNARDFGGQLVFAVVGNRVPALIFTKAAGRDLVGRVAFWLRREASIPEDRSLLPFEEYPRIVRDEIRFLVRGALEDGSTQGAGGIA